MRPGEYTGRKCDCCGFLETLQKVRKVFTATCNNCQQNNISLCLACRGRGLGFRSNEDKWVTCVNCQRDKKLSKIGIE